jgi:nicotinate phosphoribosyltransferase
MLQAYHFHRMREAASFELFFRGLTPERSFLICAGLETVLQWVQQLRFQPHELHWLASTGRFRTDFLRMLARVRFTGDIDAIAEGTPIFANEPVLRVTAPIIEAQLLESRLLNLIHFQTLIASKAARCTLAAGDAGLVEFGLRRAHGAEAALYASRAAYLAGFSASSNALAGLQFGIPVTGTMAHSFVQAHAAEALAFERFAAANPEQLVFLIDTYDIEQGAYRAAAVAHTLAARGIRLQGVRIDSGELAPASRRVRAVLDAAGLTETKILASGNLDEWRIAGLRAVEAPIDVYCVGTALSTSSDAPALDCAYKLVEYAGRPTAKRSPGKASLPGCKQVWRSFDPSGRIQCDHIALADETPAQAQACRTEALLQPVMRAGVRLSPPQTLRMLREQCLQHLDSLPDRLRPLDAQATLEPSVSSGVARCLPREPRRSPPAPHGAEAQTWA